MGLATLADLTPTTAHEVEARHILLDPRIRQKQARLADEREARHAVVEALGLKLRALREELVVKRRRLADAIANAAPEWSHGESAPGGGAGAVVTSGGFRDREVREQEVARLAEGLQHAEAAYQAAQARWATVARVVENCREFLAVTPLNRDRVVVVPVPYLSIPNARDALDAIRAKLRALATEASAIEAAPVGREEALTRLEEQRKKVAERVAARRAERVRGFFSPRGISDVARLGLAEGYGLVGRELEAAIQEAADERFLAAGGEWAKAIKAATIPGTPMPLDARAPRLAAITQETVALGREEERVIECAAHDGLTLDRRDTADPAIILTTVLAAA